MTTRVRLNLYEQGIAETLVYNFGYTKGAARELVVEYIQVVRLLGGYDTCLDHAERLHTARKNGFTPNQWTKRIEEVRRDKLKDKGLPDERCHRFA
ncbi:hypothetical protein [Cohnella silvisoli]|uniref:Uncharacterized protein n=1 Tax=Cohnella silvisoli TaxID=2873699 RepID=A0ABV1KTJ7_9BACL|nr:hypothetical protein [Cohnella silvisoli]MCD9021546.1 hypothetical protein [Cohnella silvisoli]